MKNILKYGLIALAALFTAACSPQEFNDYSMGALDTVTPEQVNFSATPSAESANKITFTNTSGLKIPYAVFWDLGNGTTGKGDVITGLYPMKGDYTVKMTVQAPDGATVTKTYNLSLTNDDFSLVASDVYVQLTGGIDDADGKTWVFDRYNNYAKEVADATGKAITGHIGLGEANGGYQGWWAAGSDEKATSPNHHYEFKLTFKQAGMQLSIDNNGKGNGRSSCCSSYPDYAAISGDEGEFTYSGGNYTFSITEREDANPTLTLPNDVILGYYVCNNVYEIIYQTGDVIALYTQGDGFDWVYVFIREDLNIAAPPIVKEPAAVPLSEDFEGETALVDFVPENMGNWSAAGYQNPAPVSVNPSPKVYLYQKSGDFYSNLSFTTTDYLFDLTAQNKIRLKVFIPSYNDYTTEYGVAGDWITNKKLLPQLAVKLQDSSKGGNAWETQTEIIKADLEKDKWLELEFDFSGVATRTDYDKIVIQFGGEGHTAPGIFFFDDFSFSE
jgi:hypothetical protein